MTSTPENPQTPNPDPTELISDPATSQPAATGPSQSGAPADGGPVPGQWQPTGTTATPVEPPEGWQAGYAKQKRRAQGFMIATIALGITTILAGVMALGLGTAMVVRNVADGPAGHSRMDDGRDFDDRGDMRGFDDRGDMRGFGNNPNLGNGQRGNRMTPTPTPTPTAPTPAPATPTPTPTS